MVRDCDHLESASFLRGPSPIVREKEHAMKNDLELRRDILDALEWEPSIDAAEIGVAVKDSIVTLTGSVKSYTEKLRDCSISGARFF
jgi:osmotically-inducible protein OsmY